MNEYDILFGEVIFVSIIISIVLAFFITTFINSTITFKKCPKCGKILKKERRCTGRDEMGVLYFNFYSCDCGYIFNSHDNPTKWDYFFAA